MLLKVYTDIHELNYRLLNYKFIDDDDDDKFKDECLLDKRLVDFVLCNTIKLPVLRCQGKDLIN